MKMTALVFAFILVCNEFLGAQDIEGGYSGSINSYVGDTGQKMSYGNLFFGENTYNLYFGATDYKGEVVIDISETYIGTDGHYSEKGTYNLAKEGVYDYIYLTNTTPFNYKNKLGFLFHPRRFYLYDGNDLFFASDEGPRWSGYDPEIIETRMSSFLTEGTIKYDAYNFRLPWRYYLRPWVEGTAGSGIGEWIEFTLERNIDPYTGPHGSSRPLDYFLFSNGYVSFKNPALYKLNNRVKKLRIICETESIDFIVELKDTPQFQEIRLPRSLTPETCVFRFVIEEVYKGTRWDDTCINLIIPMGEGVQPY